jgi:hypothetical protein
LGGDGFRAISPRGQDHFQNSFPVLENLLVPGPQYGEACLLQPSRPRVIVLRLRMLPSIGFDHALSFDTGEVEDVATERMLPAESGAIDLPAGHGLPQVAFGIGRVAS